MDIPTALLLSEAFGNMSPYERAHVWTVPGSASACGASCHWVTPTLCLACEAVQGAEARTWRCLVLKIRRKGLLGSIEA